MFNILARKASSFVNLYRDGIRQMTWGRTLWVLVAIKLFVIFVIIRLLIMHPYYEGKTPAEKQDAVAAGLIDRAR